MQSDGGNLDGGPAQRPAQRFARLFQELVDFRGPDVEAKLYQRLGQARVQELYAGAEPSFDEFAVAVEILNIPLSAFMSYQPGCSPDIEIVISEIIYSAGMLELGARKALAEDLLATVRNHSGLPETSTTVLRLLDNLREG